MHSKVLPKQPLVRFDLFTFTCIPLFLTIQVYLFRASLSLWLLRISSEKVAKSSEIWWKLLKKIRWLWWSDIFLCIFSRRFLIFFQLMPDFSKLFLKSSKLSRTCMSIFCLFSEINSWRSWHFFFQKTFKPFSYGIEGLCAFYAFKMSACDYQPLHSYWHRYYLSSLPVLCLTCRKQIE